jgi:hypothetical protein
MYALGFGAGRPITQNVSTMPNDQTSTSASPISTSNNSRALYRRVEIRLLTNNAVPTAPMRRATPTNGNTSNN